MTIGASVAEVAHQSSSSRAQSRTNYMFVDNIRFTSMLILFLEHSLVAVNSVLPLPHPEISALLLCLVKFGSIGFFLVSGFLLGRSVETSSAPAYFGRRLKRVFLPWSFWYLLFTGAIVLLNSYHRRTPIILGFNAWRVVGGWMDFTLHSPYWFVPNLLFSLGILLVFRRYLPDWRMGAVLASLSLFYAVNVYGRWIPSSHATAFFGFIFYLWLGYFLSIRLHSLAFWVDRVPIWPILLMVGSLWISSFAEYCFIHFLHPRDDPGNSLRITNQIYSLSVILLLFKVKKPLFPSFMNVRNDTFGLYLTQTPLIYVATVVLARMLSGSKTSVLSNIPSELLLTLLFTILVYLVALGLTRLLASNHLTCWLAGTLTNPKRGELSFSRISGKRQV